MMEDSSYHGSNLVQTKSEDEYLLPMGLASTPYGSVTKFLG